LEETSLLLFFGQTKGKVNDKDLTPISPFDLLEMAFDISSDFNKVAQAKKLDKYYIPTRYPNGLLGGVPSRYFGDAKEAEEAMELAKSLIGLVEKKIMETE
jgi:HEPN domain-containing protein